MSLEAKEHRIKARIAELQRRYFDILGVVMAPIRDLFATEMEIEMCLADLANLKVKEDKD